MEDDFEPTMPAALDDLTDYPKIQKIVKISWATKDLIDFLDNLLSDTRDHQRAGFPPDVGAALIQIANLNRAALAKKGWKDPEEDDYLSGFMPSQWNIPKNF